LSNRRLVEKLQSDDLATRRSAARSLAEIPATLGITERDERDISDAIDALAVALFDEDEEVRRHAASALASARRDRQDISDAMPALLQCLADPREDLRRAAILILRDAVVDGMDGAPYEEQIIPLLEDPVQEVQWAAADALTFHWASRGNWERVGELLRHADPDVPQEAAGSLAKFYFRFHYLPVLPDLLALLAAESLELRLMAARAVTRRPREAADLELAFPPLLEGIAEKDVRFRVAAIRALEEAIARWLRLQPSFRRRSQLGSRQREKLAPVLSVLTAIEGALADENGQVQAAAVRAFGHLFLALPASESPRHQSWADLIVDALDSPHSAAQKAATGVLTRMWVRDGRWAELEELLHTASNTVKRQLLITLADRELVRTSNFAPLVPAILAMVTAADSDLSYPASRALERTKTAELLPALESGPIDSETSWDMLREVRGRVHRALLSPLKKEHKAGRTPGARIAFLVEQLAHEEGAVRAWAAEALWEIALKDEIAEAIPTLTRALDDPDTPTRAAAALALGDAAKHSSIAGAFPELMRLTRDESGRVRKNAFRALGMVADAGGDIGALVPALGETLRASPHGESRSEAARLLASAAIGGAGLHDLVPELAATLDDDYHYARFYAARALYYADQAGADIQSAIGDLAQALLDQEHTVADWASTALEAYAGDARRAAMVLEAVNRLESDARPVCQVTSACEKRLEVG
jgi:HEAT repeat protein